MSIVLHGFGTSNNIKVRIALGYKGIDYEFRQIDPSERAELRRISGQFLTPVLEHDGRVLFDSAAIIRYLDANFPATPKLFGDSRSQQWEIEDWELSARTRLAGPMMRVVHARVRGEALSGSELERCAEEFEAAAVSFSEQLGGTPWLVSDSMTVADISAAAVLYRVRAAELLPLGAAAHELRPWVERVVSHDAYLA